MQTPFDLTGRVAVVTGGNGGIGRSIALGLARAGASVAILARNEEKNKSVLAELEAIGRPSFAMAFDVSKRETLAGLSGLGDLVLTCSSTSSRNYSLGVGIGEGRSAAELLSDRKTVAEGAFTAPVLARLAKEKDIDMPIVDAVDALVAGRAKVDEVLEALLTRPPRAEGV